MKTPPFELLQVLIAVAESKNFYEAAIRLKITQPSISHKMKQLESFMPMAIFQLQGKRKVLTHYGRSLYDVAIVQSNQLEKNIEQLHRQYADAEHLTLRIGGRPEVIDCMASAFNFAGKIEMLNLSSSEAVEKLRTHQIDIAISYIAPDSSEIIAKKLFQSSSHFRIHHKFLKVKNKKLSLDLVKDEIFLKQTPCIIYHKDGHMLKDWLKHLNLSLDMLKIVYVAEDWRTVQNLVDQGLGYALVPEYIQSHSQGAVQSIELPNQIMPKYTFYALYDKGLKKIEPFQKILSALTAARRRG